MPIEYLKQAQAVLRDEDLATTQRVRELLARLRHEGEPAAQALAAALDGWHGPMVLGEADLALPLIHIRRRRRIE
ncbi:MAG: hypothetical protein FGM55_15595, partial [Rhodoferax sp.]|nr:hypothetical protein [Rhodoferax sp.]